MCLHLTCRKTKETAASVDFIDMIRSYLMCFRNVLIAVCVLIQY